MIALWVAPSFCYLTVVIKNLVLTSFLMYANISENKFLKVGLLGHRMYTLCKFVNLITIFKWPSIVVILLDPSTRNVWKCLFPQSFTIRMPCQAFGFMPI